MAVLALALTAATIVHAEVGAGYCEALASVIPDAAKARDAGISESLYLAQQGINADDDIEKELVHLVYESKGTPTEMLRTNVLNACMTTDGWSHCKPLTPDTGLACLPSD